MERRARCSMGHHWRRRLGRALDRVQPDWQLLGCVRGAGDFGGGAMKKTFCDGCGKEINDHYTSLTVERGMKVIADVCDYACLLTWAEIKQNPEIVKS